MDSDSDYVTSYSVDERITEAIRLAKTEEEELNRQKDVQRKYSFERYYNENRSDDTAIFNLKGLHFLTFRHDKIKFRFQPSDIVWTNRSIFFDCSLRYRRNYWVLRRDTFPANYKPRIYNLFYKKDPSFSVNDSKIIDVLLTIYEILVDWSKKHEEFHRRRYEDYKAGLDIYLHSEEEELFLTADEIRDLHEKRYQILQRMVEEEELFLTADEIRDLHEKRYQILQRMVPPNID
ncbi:hypothetical protein QE152_g6065 [Popillia japonica]|uniref:Uncharacterized protein n=1 Tax=Popillia japonica TaxID=7064 RepID=A0AAW1MKL1_POPJA